MTRPRKKSRRKRDSNPGSSALEADALTTWPTRRSRWCFLVASLTSVITDRRGADVSSTTAGNCVVSCATAGSFADISDAISY